MLLREEPLTVPLFIAWNQTQATLWDKQHQKPAPPLPDKRTTPSARPGLAYGPRPRTGNIVRVRHLFQATWEPLAIVDLMDALKLSRKAAHGAIKHLIEQGTVKRTHPTRQGIRNQSYQWKGAR